MQINPQTAAPLLTLANSGPNAKLLETLQAGQVIKAVVLAQSAEGAVVLRIAGKQIRTQVEIPVTRGQSLLLKVLEAGAQPVVKLLNPAPPAQGASTIALSTANAALQFLKVGQQFSGSVVAQNGGSVSLRIDNTVVQGQTRLPLAPGQQLDLQLARGGEKPVLRVLASASPTDTIAQALRLALPRADGLSGLLKNLGTIARPAAEAPKALPEPVVQAVRQLLQSLPGREQVSTPDGLKQAVLNSGSFLETKLARSVLAAHPQAGAGESTGAANRPLLAADFKGGLVRILVSLLSALQGGAARTPSAASENEPLSLALSPQALRNVSHPGQANPRQGQATEQSALRAMLELMRHIESGVARVQLNQINSLPTEDRANPGLTLELPVRHGEQAEVIQLRITRDPQGDAEDPNAPGQWCATLAFELETLGPVRARVTVAGQIVSTELWAEREATVELFNRHLDTLHEGLVEAGLVVGRLGCQLGAPPEPPPRPAQRNLVSARV